MGEVVFWTLIRIILLIPSLWILNNYVDFNIWFLISTAAVYSIIIHPAILHLRLFEEKNKEVTESSLCSSCKNFDKTAVLCQKYDSHPTITFIPCEGLHWEPKADDSAEREDSFRK